MVAEKTAKKFRGPVFLRHSVHLSLVTKFEGLKNSTTDNVKHLRVNAFAYAIHEAKTSML